jgi:hypothetical protein
VALDINYSGSEQAGLSATLNFRKYRVALSRMRQCAWHRSRRCCGLFLQPARKTLSAAHWRKNVQGLRYD